MGKNICEHFPQITFDHPSAGQISWCFPVFLSCDSQRQLADMVLSPLVAGEFEGWRFLIKENNT